MAEQALDEGRLAGEVELVETGDRTLVGSADELIAFVRAHRRSPDDPADDPADREEP